MISSARHHHAPSRTLVLGWIVALYSPEPSLAFLPSPAYLNPSLLKVDTPHSPKASHEFIHLDQSPPTKLAATKCPPDWSLLDLAIGTLSNPSFSLENQNPLPFENPEICQEFYFQPEPGANDSSPSKSTFKSQLGTYQPFWMNMEAVPKASMPSQQAQAADSVPEAMSYATSYSTSAIPSSRVSKTFAIPKSDQVVTMPSSNGNSNNGSSEAEKSIASTAINEDIKSHPSKQLLDTEKDLSRQKVTRHINRQPLHPQVHSAVDSKGEGKENMPSVNAGDSLSSADKVVSKEGNKDTTVQPPNKDRNIDNVPRRSGTQEIKKQWHAKIPAAVASNGAKVVETLAKAYAHPLSSASLPAETTSAIAPAGASLAEPSNQEQTKNSKDSSQNTSMDWESRLKALEQAVISMAQGTTTLPASQKDVVVDSTTSASITTEPSSLEVKSSSVVATKDSKSDWNLIEKLREQVEALKDTIYNMQQYETKTIHWSIPRIDKHIRMSSSTTFQSDPFYVGSIPFHLELKVQEASGEDDHDEQSVSFFLYHHHWRNHYYQYEQSKYHLRPFQEERSLRQHNSNFSPIHVGGSKLKIGNLEYVFGDSAVIQVGQQDGWGWEHLMSLKELRQHQCIRRGHLDIEFKVRLERDGHGHGRVGVAMIAE